MEEFKKIGKLTKTHGLQGEIAIRVDDDRKPDLLATEKIYIEHHGYKVPYFIDRIKEAKPIRIKLEDIDTPEEAHELTNQAIYLTAEDLSDIGDDHSDLTYGFLQGVDIYLADGLSLGSVIEVLAYPQQEMAVIHYNQKEVLIPINDSYIIDVNVEANTVTMELPDGILDL